MLIKDLEKQLSRRSLLNVSEKIFQVFNVLERVEDPLGQYVSGRETAQNHCQKIKFK